MNLNQMEQWVIKPALEHIKMYSKGSARLILFTGLVESRYQYVKQIGTGPALSFWQVEPFTMNDHFLNYLSTRKELSERVRSLMVPELGREWNLLNNMAFAVAMARLKYYRSKTPMPVADDLEAQAKFYKTVYNTGQGDGSVEKFIEICQGLQQELS